MNELEHILSLHKGKCAVVNQKESQMFGSMVIDIEPAIEQAKSLSIIDEVIDGLLVLNYFDAREMHYIPLEKIIKVNVILRGRVK
ncbi:MAG TPA: hypothetical protein VMM58_01585 [Bacteroidota bacterium]|nr:hypothetical protein [Bacteroidota bacterium]